MNPDRSAMPAPQATAARALALAFLFPVLVVAGCVTETDAPPPGHQPLTNNPNAAVTADPPTAVTTNTNPDHAGHALLTDFTDPDQNRRWFMLNDNVMGGRSQGDVSFTPAGPGRTDPRTAAAESAATGTTDPAVMTFRGTINTNGGGFSSVRLPLDPGTLADTKSIRLRVKAHGPTPRPYRVLVEDDLDRRRRISHRADLFAEPAAALDTWQVVTIDLDTLTPTWRGNVMNAAPLDPARAVQLGIMLNHPVDGPFRLDIDRIELVPH